MDEEILEEETDNDKSLIDMSILKTHTQQLEGTILPDKNLSDSKTDAQNSIWWWTVFYLS